MERPALSLVVLALAVAAPATAAERLLAGIPQGFAVAEGARGPGTALLELIPEGESASDWTQRISLQTFPPTANVGSWMMAFGAASVQACPEGGFQPVASMQEDGFEVAVAVVGCPASPRDGRPAYMLLKGVDGHEALHVVQWAWSGDAPDGAALERAGAYLAQVSVCDGPRARACPVP
ncbi:hypothetical protein [Jannaschia seohaensis]|uniref:Uncharacterized protein n=1 Tax=Jannaschia seohaensis TaxID=475081 RepID=A0A2Y9B2G4_9RHOB|nr:hypothetical protein [Jannaschia seohaensis]PWJ14420.1 hypothetical protein BCF38_11243 [Jannaschia seohaensis]SSA50145.1 hypothetical protein SAMN05421539_11243 [Jannaschia seohaensis]